MKLCVLTEYFYPNLAGGTPTVLSDLVRALKDTYPELDIDVVTSVNCYRDPQEKYSAFEEWQGVKIHRIGSPRSNHQSTLIRFALGIWFSCLAGIKIARQEKYDLVFVGTNPPAAPFAVGISGLLRKTPYVYLLHDLYPDILTRLGLIPERHPLARVTRHFQKRSLHRSQKIIVIGRCMRDYITSTYGCAPEKIEVITNWSDPQAITPLARETRFREKHDLSGFLVLWAGNFGKYQNFDTLLDAARLVRDTGKDITFVFVGDGTKKEDVVGGVAERGLDNVGFYPYVPSADFCDMLGSADLSLVTLEANMEGVGVPSKFYNILASGRPTLAVLDPSSEVARVLEENDCGIRVDHGDSRQIAAEIIRCYDYPEQTRKMGENARKAFLENYTRGRIVERYYRLFQEVVENGNR